MKKMFYQLREVNFNQRIHTMEPIFRTNSPNPKAFDKFDSIIQIILGNRTYKC